MLDKSGWRRFGRRLGRLHHVGVALEECAVRVLGHSVELHVLEGRFISVVNEANSVNRQRARRQEA